MNPFIRGLVDAGVRNIGCWVADFGAQPFAEIAEPIEIGVRHTPVCVRFVLCFDGRLA